MPALAHTPQVGLILVTVAFLIAPGLDVFAKLLTQTLSPGMVSFGRFLAQSVLLVPLVWMSGQWSLPRWGHFAAGALLASALLFFNSAIQVMPIANAIAIFFVEPLILTVLSAIVLRERIGWRRILAVIIGLIGAMIVIRPNWAAYGPSSALPLGTAVCFACYMLITKVLVAGGRPLALQFWTGVSATLVLGVGLIIGTETGVSFLIPNWPDRQELIWFAGLGLLALVAHQMVVHALARVDASVVAPMQYLEIFSAVLLGWWVFGDLPDLLTWIGTAVIVGSGIYVFHRERRQNSVA